ncbi:FecR family protein [Pedobacter psychroterrae]|uniref:DUF4974 domain-containing protein n=1 Tax=Pedobacter psychroterrae TaxID=2530453 RepID=A0A4R0NPI5_9SPHI|nr:FecR family protein [Pedobacter psychroterrae]TCD02851.1 DUF4974 domain-containing protein [Pedobacter psychroterrae]
MDNKIAGELIDKYFQGRCSAEETAIIETWYNRIAEEQKLSGLPDLQQRHAQIKYLLPKDPAAGKTRAVFKIGYRIAVAASLIIAFFAVFFFYRSGGGLQDFSKVNIPPGTNKSILTLADGRKISLTDVSKGNVASQTGVNITKTAEGTLIYQLTGDANDLPSAINRVETPVGGQQIILLPDGSKVYLNAASSLTFSSGLGKEAERRLELSGEAYFEVAKDKAHPFIVSSGKHEVRVLGTHFNISCYAGEIIKTTLLEGAVKIHAAADIAVLKPGQQSVFTESQDLKIHEADLDEAVAWKNGYFRFNEEKIRDVMKKIARWYNIDVQYSGDLTNEGFTGTISRYTNISDVLKMLQGTKAVHFEVEGRRVTVMP